MKNVRRLISNCIVALGVVATPATMMAVPLVLVPDDQPTLTDALVAVSPGGTVRITDSGIYEEAVALTKAGVTLEAAWGSNPTILYPAGGPSYLVFANQPVQIGSSTGGRIKVDGGGRDGMSTMLNVSHVAGEVVFENLDVEGMTGSVNVIYPGPATTGDIVVRDTLIDANYECQFPVRLDFVNPGETLTFENVALLGAGSRGVFSSSLGGGTFNLTNSYIESFNTGIDLTTGAGAYTINISNSYVYAQFGTSSGGAIYARSAPTLTAVNSVFRCGGPDSYAVYLFTDGASTSGGSFTFDNCDIIADGTTFAALRLVSAATSDTVTIRDSNVVHLTAANRSLFGTPDGTDVVTIDYNSLSGSRGGFPAALSTEYAIIPDYTSIADGVFTYLNATLIVGDSSGMPVGSFEDFRDTGSVLLVDLVDFEATSAGVGHPVTISWSTASELDNVGFNLYRLRFVNGVSVPAGRVNTSLIPGAGTTSDGSDYQVVDSIPLDQGERRGYVLVDIDANGNSTRHGPIHVQATTGAPSGEQDWLLY